ncbi:hypothetical protein J2852_003037 [Azospirillum soli]|nr:hypothetical protein [Azospirillum soli]
MLHCKGAGLTERLAPPIFAAARNGGMTAAE